MAFGSFAELQEVLQQYHISAVPVEFVERLALTVPPLLQERINFFKVRAPIDVSESAVCEFLIAPILQEMWLLYADDLTLWSHAYLGIAPPLNGYPDYFLSRRSPLGRVLDQPYVLFIEAKSDDFDMAWAQCLAAMLAAQQLNKQPGQVIYGGVSSGEVWYFGKLDGKTLFQDPRAFTLSHLDELWAVLNFVFRQADQLARATGEEKQS